MFSYVPNEESKDFRVFCSDKLNQLKQNLKNQGIEVNFYLVGSGMKNLVTRNGNENYDLDYNIEFLNRSISQLNPQKAKDYIMNFLNGITIGKKTVFKNCQDSTSAITARLVRNGNLEFSFDVAILAKKRIRRSDSVDGTSTERVCKKVFLELNEFFFCAAEIKEMFESSSLELLHKIAGVITNHGYKDVKEWMQKNPWYMEFSQGREAERQLRQEYAWKR